MSALARDISRPLETPHAMMAVDQGSLSVCQLAGSSLTGYIEAARNKASFEAERRSFLLQEATLPLLERTLDSSYWHSRAMALADPEAILRSCLHALSQYPCAAYLGDCIVTSDALCAKGMAEPGQIAVDLLQNKCQQIPQLLCFIRERLGREVMIEILTKS